MVAIGSCDYCGEFCQSLGVNAVEFMVSDVEEDAVDLDDFEEIEDEDEDDPEVRLDEFREERLERFARSSAKTWPANTTTLSGGVSSAEEDGYDWIPGAPRRPLA